MAKIEFPKPLRYLLEGSDLQAPIRAFADQVGEILSDNKLSFFPDYTDHGIDHINSVLRSEGELVPIMVWESSKKDSDPRLLCDVDAVVIIGATLLHDIAMHLWPDGFRELIGKRSYFKPLPWFNESHAGHPADRPWKHLWEEYVLEARKFSERDLANILGEDSASIWKFHDLPQNMGEWDSNHRRIIGEFIRRHHSRLAHEIAINGFPGLPVSSGEDNFPAMGKKEGHPLKGLADLIGLVARSHGMSLRTCKSYLDDCYPRTPRPMGTAVFYPMALLRIADFLQIDKKRAPNVLLQLRNPQSPISVQEWKKQQAVEYLGPSNDPRGKMVTVSHDVSLNLYLQLEDILSNLQSELDNSAAILDEIYGTLTEIGLNQLNLAIRRIDSNLHDPAFIKNLPYVPSRTEFSADPHLLTLLVEPLYGKESSVGVRELMQNAVDAVRELEEWCKVHGKSIQTLDLPEQDNDVLIEFIKYKDGNWLLRVRDKGIGMRSETIQNYFLRAGASFRQSAEWTKEFIDEHGRPRVIRSGKFGIGAFAIFLLGPHFKLWTRHAGEEKSNGFKIEASAYTPLIEIKRDNNLPIGTTIEVELSEDSAINLRLNEIKGPENEKIDWFCWDWPKVVKQVIRDSKPKLIPQEFDFPIHKKKLPPEWAVIYPKGFDAVYWTFKTFPKLTCNGLKITNPSKRYDEQSFFNWPKETQMNSPNLAVLDSAGNFPLTIQRYELSQKTVPFINQLVRDVILSFIAHILVCGPNSFEEGLLGESASYPLIKGPQSEDPLYTSVRPITPNFTMWPITATNFVPADPWLYSLLNTESYCVFGVIQERMPFKTQFPSGNSLKLIKQKATGGSAIFPWHGFGEMALRNDGKLFLKNLANKGVAVLGHKVETSQVLISAHRKYDLVYLGKQKWKNVKIESTRNWSWIGIGDWSQYALLKNDLIALEQSILEQKHNFLDEEYTLYVSEIKHKRMKISPKSLIAKVWNETLGMNAIPFDRTARRDLINKGCEHSELKHHIDSWREMKRTNSKFKKTMLKAT